ncbi:MAG: 6-bladed beta-propeller, partial [Acidobacteria bacterium]|nr:6-bladed beta-propeller [Acidobacteriota bacterium]
MNAVGRTILVLSLLAVACGAPSNSPGFADTTWVGTITTEGDVTTVVNESGSAWGGTAALVEEASIGVDVGAEPYMLAGVASIIAGEDRIYVLETRPPTVRVYDMSGTHIQDIGSEGQGPGEFQGPLMSMVRTPGGNIFVRDDYSSRMSVFSPAGELLDTWSLPGGFRTRQESVATNDGTVYVPQVIGRDPDNARRPRIGMVPYDAHGNPGELLAEPQLDHEPPDFPPIVRPRPGGGTRSTLMPIPFFPRPVTVMSPRGAWVAGVGDSYRFEIRYFDGTLTVVERRIDPVPVSAAEAAERRRRTTARARSRD